MKAAYVSLLLLSAIASKQVFAIATDHEGDQGSQVMEEGTSAVQSGTCKMYRFTYRTSNAVQGSHDDHHTPQTPDMEGRLHSTAMCVRVVSRNGNAALCELRMEEEPTFAVFNPKHGRFGPAARDPECLGKLLEGPSFQHNSAALHGAGSMH